jgi:broad specificity phosphatase PhoE
MPVQRRPSRFEAARLTTLVLLGALAFPAWADDLLWKKLETEPNLVVLMRHVQPAGGNPLTWDESGNCKGEAMLTSNGQAHAKRIGEAFAARGVKPRVVSSPMCRCRDTARIAFGTEAVTEADLREIVTADSERTKRFEDKAQSLIATHRGAAPVVFVSHRPNIDRLTMELVDEGELLVGRANASGEVEVLGRMKIP